MFSHVFIARWKYANSGNVSWTKIYVKLVEDEYTSFLLAESPGVQKRFEIF